MPDAMGSKNVNRCVIVCLCMCVFAAHCPGDTGGVTTGGTAGGAADMRCCFSKTTLWLRRWVEVEKGVGGDGGVCWAGWGGAQSSPEQPLSFPLSLPFSLTPPLSLSPYFSNPISLSLLLVSLFIIISLL